MMRCTQRLLTIQLCHQSSEEPGRELSPSVCHQGSAHPMVFEYMFNEKPGVGRAFTKHPDALLHPQ